MYVRTACFPAFPAFSLHFNVQVLELHVAPNNVNELV